MNHPLVSVVICVYNGERFLGEALDSVFAQDYRPIEVIVIDDGSEDRSAEIARSYEGVKVVPQENRGLAAARNAGIEAAAGELIAFLDADDVMLPTKLRDQVGYLLDHPRVGYVLCRQKLVPVPGTDLPPWARPDRIFGDPGGVPPVSGVVTRAALLAAGNFDASLRTGDGLEWLGRLREAGVVIHVLPKILLLRRVHERNLTHDQRSLTETLFRTLHARAARAREARKEEKLVSVVMTVYNAEPYLREAIESVLQQTYSPIELVVLDDGSNDWSSRIASTYADRIVHLRRQRAGMGAARNEAVAHTRGAFLAFLDADDRFLPRKTEQQMAAFEEDDSLEVVYGHVREFLSPDLPANVAEGLRRPARRLPGRLPSAMLIRRESFFRVGPFQTELRVGVGLDWSARAAEAGLRSKMLDDVVYERRLHAANNALRERAHGHHYLVAVKAALDRRRSPRHEGPQDAP